ncbi:MAG: adenylate/guanylate cyclase domain-containing protein [Myxococcales bacterium]|nr:adenylate/guanylate cyclase domain-containing protein [Myxococcales bacterium]
MPTAPTCATLTGTMTPTPASPNTAAHSLWLHFRDEDLERRYRRWFYHANRRYFQLGSLVGLAVMLAIGVVELSVFDAAVLGPVMAIRLGVVIPICTVMYVFVTVRRFEPFVERYRQLITLVLIPTAFFALGWIGSITIRAIEVAPEGYGALGFVIGMLFMYLVVRVRFAYALAVCVPLNLLLVPALLISDLDPLTTTAAILFTWVSNGVGAAGCYLADRSWRQIFLDEVSMQSQWHRVEGLLRRVLPSSIVPRLHESPGALAERFAETTVLFADVVGFTPLAARLPATELVGLLDALFCRFDALAEQLGIAKVKTIGDAWMGVAGAPVGHPAHAAAAAWLAHRMETEVQALSREKGIELQLRIGLHSGSLVGGVIGERKFAWDVWGDTVNVAARMESTGEAGQVQLSPATAKLLAGAFETTPRGPVDIKGKGVLTTHWLGAPLTDMPPAPPPQPESAAPRMETLRSPSLHPFSLRFYDKKLERAYWDDFFDRNIGKLRVMGWCALLSVLPAIPAEAHFFPAIAEDLNLWRFCMLTPTILIGVILVSVPTLAADITKPHLQPIFAAVALLSLTAMGGMGMEVLYLQKGHPLVYVSLGYLTTISVLYVLVRMPFIYTALICVSTIAVGTVAALSVPGVDARVVAMAIHLCGLGSVAGALACYSLELADRRHFELRRRIAAEHERADVLLANTLPRSIARRLDAGEQPLADAFGDVSVIFADLVGFTDYASTVDAEELVSLLDELFRRFDRRCDALGAEKIKTIGDAWMAVVGAPHSVDDHTEVAVQLGLALQDEVKDLCATRDLPFSLRVGVHRGSLVAGVLGRDRVQFDIWGDTVNVASRMESHGVPAEVHVSAAVAERLAGRTDSDLHFEPRGEVDIKGRGPMNTAFARRIG